MGVDELVVGERGQDGFVIDLAADQEEVQRESSFVARGFMSAFGFLRSLALARARLAGRWNWMSALHRSTAKLSRSASMNDFPAEDMFVDPSANFRRQL